MTVKVRPAMVSVPVGAVVTELEPEATVMVTVSVVPAPGEVVTADSVVSEESSDEEPVVGHAVSKL